MMRWSLVGLALLVGCGSDAAATDGGSSRDTRGGGLTCAPGVTPLEVGRCARAAGGECNGSIARDAGAGVDAGAGEDGRFTPMGGRMALVVGPQGATMFVFALRTTGIDPGDPARPTASTNPLVEISLTDNDTSRQLTDYALHRFFAPDPTAPGSVVDPENWVVVSTRISLELNGHSLTAVANLTDRNGEERCNTVTFTAFQP